jgi:hypothetical protein
MRERQRAKSSILFRSIAGPFAVPAERYGQCPSREFLDLAPDVDRTGVVLSLDSSVLDAGGEDDDTDQGSDKCNLDEAASEQPMSGLILGAS